MTVGAYAPRNHQPVYSCLFHGPQRLGSQHVDNGSLCPGCEVGPLLLRKLACVFLEPFATRQYSSFQAAETEIKVFGMQHGARQRVGHRVTSGCQRGQSRPSRISQSKQHRCFIEGLACCVVKRFAEELITPYSVDTHQLGVAP